MLNTNSNGTNTENTMNVMTIKKISTEGITHYEIHDKHMDNIEDIKTMLSGDPSTVVSGPTASGKSTLILSVVDSAKIRKALKKLMIGSGCSTRYSKTYTATDAKDIDPDELVLSGEYIDINTLVKLEAGEEIRKLLYIIAEYLNRAGYIPESELTQRIRNKLGSIFDDEKSNVSFLTKLKACFDDETRENFFNTFAEFFKENYSMLMGIYSDTEKLLKDDKPGRKVRRFADEFSKNMALNNNTNVFDNLYECITAIFTRGIEFLKSSVEAIGGIWDEEAKSFVFCVNVGDWDNEDPAVSEKSKIQKDLLNLLVGYNNDSLDFLIEHLQIIFRGNKEMLKTTAPKYKYVDGGDYQYIRSISFLDTRGWFHKLDSPDIADIAFATVMGVKEFNAKDAIVVINPVDGGHKNALAVVESLVEQFGDYELDLTLVVTHFNSYVVSLMDLDEDLTEEEAIKTARENIDTFVAEIRKKAKGLRNCKVHIDEPIIYDKTNSTLPQEIKEYYNFDDQFGKFLNKFRTFRDYSVSQEDLDKFHLRTAYSSTLLSQHGGVINEINDITNDCNYYYPTTAQAAADWMRAGEGFKSRAEVFTPVNTKELVGQMYGYCRRAVNDQRPVIESSCRTIHIEPQQDADVNRFWGIVLANTNCYVTTQFVKELAKDGYDNGFNGGGLFSDWDKNTRFKSMLRRIAMVLKGNCSPVNNVSVTDIINEAYKKELEDNIKRFAIIVYNTKHSK